MANPFFNRDKAARIVLDAVVMGDRPACEKHGISLRTLQRYRTKLEDDAELSQVVAQKKEMQDEAWANEIPSAIAACINYLKDSAAACVPGNPDAIHAVSGALKIMTEVELTRKLIDARLASED